MGTWQDWALVALLISVTYEFKRHTKQLKELQTEVKLSNRLVKHDAKTKIVPEHISSML